MTTKYKIPHANPPPNKYKPSSQRTEQPKRRLKKTKEGEGPVERARNLQAHLVLKAYEAHSGVCLKYRTDKAAEVGRLVAGFGRCGRTMAGLAAEPAESEAAMAVDLPASASVQTQGNEVKTATSKKKKKGKR